MKLTALAVVILALGIVVGFALAGGPSGGPASAIPQCPGPSAQCATPTPTPPQQREDQITITAARVDFVAGEFWQSPAASFNAIVALDPADYPAGTEYRYESVLAIESADMTGCTRLYNLTTDLPVAGSEICLTVTTPPLTERLRSGPIALSSGENEYTIQSICLQPACGASWHATRIIAEWTE